MTYLRNLILIVLVFCLGILLYAHFISGIPFREMLGQGKLVAGSQTSPPQETADATVPAHPEAPPQGKPPEIPEKQTGAQQGTDDNKNAVTFDFDSVQSTLALVDEKQRNALLDDEESFRNFVKKEAVDKSVYAAARANKIDQNEKNQLIARRATDNIMREIYLRQLIASKIPKDFPAEEQVKAYYEKNKDKFVLEERIPVWQIFLPVAADKPQKETEILKKQAEGIISDISKNRMDFASAAYKYSAHLESKFNGGFMGMVKISDLKPELQKTLRDLPPDKISSPVSADDGLHILKRGPLVARQELKLEDVREQIKQLMLRQARTELRQAIFKQAAISYPVDMDDKHIEEWRQRLRVTHASPENATKM